MVLRSRIPHNNNASFKTILVAFCGGMFMGVWLYHIIAMSPFSASSTLLRKNYEPSGIVVTTLKDTPYRNTSHVDQESGRPIVKQQLLEPHVLPNFVGFSIATLKPGQVLPTHEHETLHEMFYVVEGTGRLYDGNKRKYDLTPGTLLSVPPRQKHGLAIPKENKEPLKLAVFGVIVE